MSTFNPLYGTPILFLFFVFNLNIIIGQGCLDPSLIDQTTSCPTVVDPVCGCNGVTYSNACYALAFGGVTSWIKGNCSNNINCLPILTVNGTPTTATYESTIQTYSDASIVTGEYVVFESETEVYLDNGFDTDQNCNFVAEIDICNDADLCVGDCTAAANFSTQFYMHNGGDFEFWYKGLASLCPSTAVQVSLMANGNVLYNNIIEVADAMTNPTDPILVRINVPIQSTIDLSLNLVATGIAANAGINCLVLGNAEFGLSF